MSPLPANSTANDPVVATGVRCSIRDFLSPLQGVLRELTHSSGGAVLATGYFLTASPG